ncbi:unnamed protein product [Caenorhabditis nigoni]
MVVATPTIYFVHISLIPSVVSLSNWDYSAASLPLTLPHHPQYCSPPSSCPDCCAIVSISRATPKLNPRWLKNHP